MAVIVGTARNDRLRGTGDRGDELSIYGREGDDLLTGGFWPDNFLYGEGGNDTLEGHGVASRSVRGRGKRSFIALF